MKYQFEPENQRAKIIFDYLKGDYEKMKEMLNIDWESYLAESLSNIASMLLQ